MKVAVTAETLSIHIKLGHLDCKIKGIMCLNLNIDISAGLNWFWQLKPVIDWKSSVLAVSKNGVIYKIYPNFLDY